MKAINMKNYFKRNLFILIFIQISLCFAQAGISASDSGLSKGETLFKENNAADAVQVLEYEILQGQISENTYNFLGLGYLQLEQYEKSIDAFRRPLAVIWARACRRASPAASPPTARRWRLATTPTP